MSKEQAAKLKQEGKSLAEIAKALGVSKSTAHRWVHEVPHKDPLAGQETKSWLNPRWVTIGGERQGPVDVYGAIEEPDAQTLLGLYEDTVYACTKWLSDTVSTVPLKVYVKTAGLGREPKATTAPVTKAPEHLASLELREVLDHTFVDIIQRPNPDMSRLDLLRLIDIDISLCGNAYVLKHRAEDGLPEQLWPLQPDRMKQAFDDAGHHVGWWEELPSGMPRFLKREDVIWFKLVDPRNPYGPGYSVVRGVYERVLIAKNEAAYLLSLYRNQARPDSIISIKGIVAQEAERVQKEINQRFRQGGIHGVWVVDGEEVDAKPIQWAPKDNLGVDLYRWSKLQILNAFGLNPAIFDTDSANRAVAETARYMAMINGVVPRLRLIEERLNLALAPEFDDRLLLAFDNPVPEDRQYMLRKHMVDGVVMTINERRRDIGLPSVPGGNVIQQVQAQDKRDVSLPRFSEGEEDDA